MNKSMLAKNGYFMIFCADLNRHEKITEMKGVQADHILESTEKFMVATIDAALAAQNASIAAESMGLGICYIGGIRNHIEEVHQLLEMPKRVIPLFGLCIGYPAHEPSKKPRLPLENIFHEELYSNEKGKRDEELSQYDEIISAYYKNRTEGKREDKWTEQVISTLLEGKQRMHMKEFIMRQGLLNK